MAAKRFRNLSWIGRIVVLQARLSATADEYSGVGVLKASKVGASTDG
jgi:hypothetical protein